MIRAAIRYPVSTMMVFGGLLLLGALSYTHLPGDLLPRASKPRWLLVTRLPGHVPAQVESLLTKPLEASIATIAGVESIRSVSRHEESLILAEFTWETSDDRAQIELQKKLFEGLPPGAEPPRLVPYEPFRSPLLLLAVRGPYAPRDLRAFAELTVSPTATIPANTTNENDLMTRTGPAPCEVRDAAYSPCAVF